MAAYRGNGGLQRQPNGRASVNATPPQTFLVFIFVIFILVLVPRLLVLEPSAGRVGEDEYEVRGRQMRASLAFHNYYDTYAYFPLSQDGKILKGHHLSSQ